MYISVETPAQTTRRLLTVIGEAQFEVLSGPYEFVESSVDRFPLNALGNALAFVKDDEVWSALVPSVSSEREQFVVFSFHFPPQLDNSGFVGWLASHLKSTLGTGVFVVCGQNTKRGGIFDYWGAPVAMANDVVAEVTRLRTPSGPLM